VDKTVNYSIYFSKIYSRRLTLKQFLQEASYNSNMDILISSKRVSLVYFRAAYSEKDFTDEVGYFLFRNAGKPEK
jgi:hypothetical protein